jgi:hypothetical protein
VTVYEVSYDLSKHGQDYDDLHDAIRSLGDHHHALESYWFVDASGTSTSEIRNDLKSHIDGDDSLIVTKMPQSGGGRSAYTNASSAGEWLEEHLN